MGRLVVVCGALLVVAGIGAAALFAVVAYYSRDLPSVSDLGEHYSPPQITRVLARDGTMLDDVFTERRTVIGLENIPDRVKLSFLAAEDARFFEHTGVNYMGIVRAAIANLKAGRTVQGGSTITQQVAKNVFLESERSYARKIREAVLAHRIEDELNKEEIFHLYLNHIYFGHGRYGVEEAARFYFGKSTQDLSLSEAALLAGIVAAPERFTPKRHEDRALARRSYVLDQMLVKEFITQEVHDAAGDEPIRLAPSTDFQAHLAPEAVSYARTLLKRVVGDDADLGGYEVHTTIDPELQAKARAAVRKNLDAYAARQKLAAPYTKKGTRSFGKPYAGDPKPHRTYVGEVTSADDTAGVLKIQVGAKTGTLRVRGDERHNPKHLAPSKFAELGARLQVSFLDTPEENKDTRLRLELGPQSALVAVDVATREVRALVGNYEAETGTLDRGLNTKRQPGSVFKPFVYSYALHTRRFTPATVLEVASKRKSEGDTVRLSLRDAIAKSRNEATLRVFQEAGPTQVVRWAKALGIQSEMKPDLSLPLGAYEASPLEMANAYGTFASGGIYAPPVIVTKIVGPDGKEIPLPPTEPPRRVMDEGEAYLTTSMLQSVIKYGTGRRAKGLKHPVAGKTGTTNDARDAWFVGYSTELSTAVWVGFDDNRPLGRYEEGARTALPGWLSFMQTALKNRPMTNFPVPHDIVSAEIDPETGHLAYYGQDGAITEQFLDGTVPEEVALPPFPDDPFVFPLPLGAADFPATQMGHRAVPLQDLSERSAPRNPPVRYRQPDELDRLSAAMLDEGSVPPIPSRSANPVAPLRPLPAPSTPEGQAPPRAPSPPPF